MDAAPPFDLRADARKALPDADYGDSFRTGCPELFTAEAWARSAFEGPDRRHRLSQQSVWRGVLQLDLGPLDEPARVAGWEVVEQTDERLVLRAGSWHLAARLVFDAEPDGARVTTLVRYRNPAGRAAWAMVGPLHRRAVPGILAAARKRLVRG